MVEFPEEGDKVEFEHERERENKFQKSSYPVWDLLAKKWENENRHINRQNIIYRK